MNLNWYKKATEATETTETAKYDTSLSPEEGAKLIRAMSPEERDNTIHYDLPGGYGAYILYEAYQLMPKKTGVFKKINCNNSDALWKEGEYLVNVNGKPILAVKEEDPDATDEPQFDQESGEELHSGYIWSFYNPARRHNAEFKSSFSHKEYAIEELIKNGGAIMFEGL